MAYLVSERFAGNDQVKVHHESLSTIGVVSRHFMLTKLVVGNVQNY